MCYNTIKKHYSTIFFNKRTENMENSYINYFNMDKKIKKNIHINAPENVFYNPCIGYILKGCAEFHYKGKVYYAKENDLIYIAKGTRYYSIWSGNPEIEFYSINYSFVSSFDKSEFEFQILSNFPQGDLNEIFEKKETHPFESLGKFYIFLQRVYENLKENKKQKNSLSPAIKYIEDNPTKKISTEYLASLCNYSQSRFFSLFKNYYGCTFVEYKNNLIVHKAIELLTETDKTIEEIANELEFSSSSYFRKVFKNITGKNPKDIRKII